jgi:hypothetical protein
VAIDKTYTDLIDRAHWDTNLRDERPWPKPAKYKSIEKDDPFDGIEVKVGMRVIGSVDRNRRMDRAGYILGTIIDYVEDGDFVGKYLVIEIIDVSCEELNPLIYRIRTASFTGRRLFSFGSSIDIVEVGKANWEKYKVTT